MRPIFALVTEEAPRRRRGDLFCLRWERVRVNLGMTTAKQWCRVMIRQAVIVLSWKNGNGGQVSGCDMGGTHHYHSKESREFDALAGEAEEAAGESGAVKNKRWRKHLGRDDDRALQEETIHVKKVETTPNLKTFVSFPLGPNAAKAAIEVHEHLGVEGRMCQVAVWARLVGWVKHESINASSLSKSNHGSSRDL